MNVAVLTRSGEPCSHRVYLKNMVHELTALDVEIISFLEAGPIPPGSDLVWDPGLCMRRNPEILKTSPVPIVGTVHGVKAFSLPIWELTTGWPDWWQLFKLKRALVRDWKWVKKKTLAVVAVSEYGAAEVARAFRLPHSMVHPIYHGTDHRIFQPDGERRDDRRPYFFSISSRNPIKNVHRLFAAYGRLPQSTRPDLVALLPDFAEEVNVKGIHIIRRELSQAELARWYRGALGFVLPSLRETFSMVILEAMACGCPVITSNTTGCLEISREAALLIDPRSVDQIARAMDRFANDEKLRDTLRARGTARAGEFTWRSSAEKMVRVFHSMMASGPEQ